jgi:dTDP-4-amino-4,6-dideoxygalactose transaminase
MAVPFFNITRQNEGHRKALDNSVGSVITSGRYILGENVAALEKEFALLCGTKYAVAVASGTDALHLALRASGVGPGDEVITSPFTFVATAEAIAYCGARPVFADIDARTFNLAPDEIRKKITPKTKAILPVHLYGQSCDMNGLMAIADKHGIAVIEDAAQAVDAGFNGKKVGSFGAAGCFSFFPTKNLGCFGDGGMVTTNRESMAEEIRVLRGHGSRKTYYYDMIGYNSRLDEIQAAILRVKLPFLSSFSDKRRKNAAYYRGELKGIGQITLPFEHPQAKHVFNQFTLRVKDRESLLASLKTKGVGAMVYYPHSLHLQKAFAALGHKPGDFPQSEAAQAEVLSLPIFPELTPAELKEVCSAIQEHYNK